MRLTLTAALVALTTVAGSSEASARHRHHHRPIAAAYVALPEVAHEPTFLERLTGRLNYRLNQVEHGLDYVATAGRGSVQAIVTQEAQAAGVPVQIAHAVIRKESGYNCRAKNPGSSAAGAGQLTRGTARAMGVRNVYDCRDNIRGSMRYLRQAVDKGGAGCAGVSLYQTGTGARPHCSAYGASVMRMARS